MPAQIGNLVWETSTTTGTGNLTTSRNGGYQRGDEAFGTGDDGADNPYIFIVNRDAAAAEWEIRPTYWSATGTLVRSGAPTLSSNANATVDFGAGTKDITNDIPAAFQISNDNTRTLTNKDLSSTTNTLRAASDTVTGAIEIAVQSEMEAGTSTTLAVTPGRQHFHPSAVKGWIKANTSGGINASYNVSGITDGGTGNIVVTWDTDFSSANYAVSPDAHDNSTACSLQMTSQLAGSATCQCFTIASSPANHDPNVSYQVMACGDQ